MDIKNQLPSSLSQSTLWEKMQEYYEQSGPKAWQDNLVPYQITSNKLLAHLYVTLINAAIYDYNLNINNKQQHIFYILELGAGHGKFSFYILKFLDFFNTSTNYKFLYIASDISQQNIDYWQKHPALQKYIKNNQLDFAKYDPSKDNNIYLLNSKVTIEQNSLDTPMFVIANYIFDTLPHDAFQCQNNELFASNILIENQNSSKQSIDFNKLKYKYNHEKIIHDYYQQTFYNQILDIYKQQLTNGAFLLPIGALRSIDQIKLFSKNNTIFLVADKGNTNLSEFKDIEDPNIAIHGSISFMVNYHAIQTFFEIIGGSSMILPNNNTDLQIACFSANKINNNLLQLTVKNILYDINPQNLISIFYTDNTITKWKNLDQVLSVLAISKWDPDLFYDLSDQLSNFIEKEINKGIFNVEQEKTILEGLELVWDYFFQLEKNQDLPFVLANLYYSLEYFELAAKFFKISIQEFGETQEALYNIKLCNEALYEQS